MAQARSFGNVYALVMLALVCSGVSGQLTIAGCAHGSCNPSAHGGTSLSSSQGTQSTSMEQPAQQAGGNPLVDLVGALGPFVPLMVRGCKLMMHQAAAAAADSISMRQLKQLTIAGCSQGSCNPTATGGTAISTSRSTQVTEVQQAPQASGGGDPFSNFLKSIFGGRRLMGVQEQVQAPAGGLRRLQCIEPNLAQCRAWGPSQCGMPGVNDRCPCMCSGLSTPGGPSQGAQGPPIILISQETTAIGCKDGSCNPNAQGGNASGRRC